MDNGRTTPTSPTDAQAFFTSGPGVNSENANNVMPEDNLDLTNQSWDANIQRDPRSIGGTTMASMGTNETSPSMASEAPGEFPVPNPNYVPNAAPNRPRAPETPNPIPGMGEIVPLEMPPDIEPQTEHEQPEEKKDPRAFNPADFHPQGDKISHTTEEAVKRMISTLSDDPATFKEQYDEARKAYQGKSTEKE